MTDHVSSFVGKRTLVARAVSTRTVSGVVFGNHESSERRHFIFSSGLLNPPRRFMYCLHVRCLCTLTAPSAFVPTPLP